MKELRTIILDLDVRSGHGMRLREILQSCDSPTVLLRRHIMIEEPGPAAASIGSVSFSLQPQLIFLILPVTSPGAGDLVKAVSEKVRCPIVALLGNEEPEDQISLIRSGVTDFLATPPRREDVLACILRAAQREISDDGLLKRCREGIALKRMIGDDPAFSAETGKIPVLARCDASVLITGETGTGKELCARAIHYLSRRSDQPFVPVNCGALPLDLVENEIFGHEKGAFTHAFKSSPGMIQEADGGTLFLDEIDSLPFQAQSKLLRLLQDGEYRQLGSNRLRHADLRVIAATNVDLDQLLAANRFRPDLYYRLNIIPIHLPPLRERKRDIPLLAEHFLRRYAQKYESRAERFSNAAFARLSNYPWPGNIRELENVIHRAVLLCGGETVEALDLPQAISEVKSLSFKDAKSTAVNQFEKRYLHELLTAHGGNISKAAKAAQKHRRAFWELIRKHEMNIQQYLPQSRRA